MNNTASLQRTFDDSRLKGLELYYEMARLQWRKDFLVMPNEELFGIPGVGPAAFGDQVVWLVSDNQGQIVDRSKQPGTGDFLAQASHVLRGENSTPCFNWRGECWPGVP